MKVHSRAELQEAVQDNGRAGTFAGDRAVLRSCGCPWKSHGRPGGLLPIATACGALAGGEQFGGSWSTTKDWKKGHGAILV